MMVNWEFFDNQTPDSAKQLVDDLGTARRSADPGPEEALLVQGGLAGAGRPARRPGGDGPSANGPSLEGLKIAKANGWKAPEASSERSERANRHGMGSSWSDELPGEETK